MREKSKNKDRMKTNSWGTYYIEKIWKLLMLKKKGIELRGCSCFRVWKIGWSEKLLTGMFNKNGKNYGRTG